jgi:hypothetical protein
VFSRGSWDFRALGENPQKFQELLLGLRAHYEPVGTAEELLVERMAVCWWRLSRVWRHENSVTRKALLECTKVEGPGLEMYCLELDQEDAKLIRQLKNVCKEIRANGKLTEEMKQSIFAMNPLFET